MTKAKEYIIQLRVSHIFLIEYLIFIFSIRPYKAKHQHRLLLLLYKEKPMIMYLMMMMTILHQHLYHVRTNRLISLKFMLDLSL